MSQFAQEYWLFAFISGLGAIQIGASFGGLKGLLLFKSPLPARAFGAALIVGSAVWFFASGDRNVSDQQGGLDANGQGLYFFYGAFAAVVVTFVVSSVVNIGLSEPSEGTVGGFDALKHTTYIRALWRGSRHWSREWRTQTKKYFFG